MPMDQCGCARFFATTTTTARPPAHSHLAAALYTLSRIMVDAAAKSGSSRNIQPVSTTATRRVVTASHMAPRRRRAILLATPTPGNTFFPHHQSTVDQVYVEGPTVPEPGHGDCERRHAQRDDRQNAGRRRSSLLCRLHTLPLFVLIFVPRCFLPFPRPARSLPRLISPLPCFAYPSPSFSAPPSLSSFPSFRFSTALLASLVASFPSLTLLPFSHAHPLHLQTSGTDANKDDAGDEYLFAPVQSETVFTYPGPPTPGVCLGVVSAFF
ncbi:hypothetical protein C8R45DRAFT_1208910 [Mycena sanguinolenta]|nr:hypothetical protein C8R45DRAFT_1208910 [Mycena sanguinolenta]